MIVPLYSVHIPPGIDEKLSALLRSGNLSGGENVALFERKLQALIGTHRVIVTGEMSGSIAMSLYLAGVRPGDEVIASPMACLATNAPISNLFADVKWCDCDPRSGSIDPRSIAESITSRTKAILVFHWAGNPADLPEIYKVAEDAGIPVVEDASEAIGSEYQGRKVGNTGGDFVVYSFYPNRHVTTIQGAAIAIKDQDLFERARRLRRYGIHEPLFRNEDGEINDALDIKEVGWNNSMNHVSGLIGVAQMDSLEDRLEINQSNGRFYDDALRDIKGVNVLKRLAGSKSAYWVYTFLADDRDRLLKHLNENGVQTSKVHIRNDGYSCFRSGERQLSGVSEFSRRAISIPCGWWVSRSQREWIIELIAAFK
jgi:dTDP-4-amino-4,6-dideoxygalactose transaminase